MSYSGKFFPRNPKKYKGDVNNIWYRSLWERNVMVKLDEWDCFLEWSSEEHPIPYRSPKDGRIHRYFVDFVARVKYPDGKIKTVLIEVKPEAQTKPPKKKKRVTKTYINALIEYEVNQAKWAAARALCEDKGWLFQVITENEIFGKHK